MAGRGVRRRGVIGALLPVAASLGASAEAAVPSPPADKPFAEHFLVLQLSDREPAKHALVLSVANNMMKAVGTDKIAIEVVAFGPGIDLLRADSKSRADVDSLISQGVAFDVCMNTVETVERETGTKVGLNPNINKVEAGVARILSLVERGYTLVRP
jgi:intracellular sulfur oxidation DsrE/DsrF family protein